MPVNPAIRTLAQDGRISLADAQKMKQAVASGTASQADIKDAVARYAEAMDSDAATLLSDSFEGATRAKLASLPAGFTNKTLEKGMRSADVGTLQRGLMSAGLSSMNSGMALKSGADGIYGGETETSVRAFQKANGLPETGKADPVTLKALNAALAGNPNAANNRPAATPPASTVPQQPGVRPSTGLRRPETPAAPAAAANAPGGTTTPTQPSANTSTAPAATATPATTAPATTAPAASTTAPAPTASPTPSLVGAPVPSTTAAPTAAATTNPASPLKSVPLPGDVAPSTSAAVTAAATQLATGPRAQNYGKDHPWKNIDPNHNAPVDVRMGGLKDRWKCNLFGGNALAAAGFEPPYYDNKKKGGEYAVAEQWHRWSTPSAELKARSAAEGAPAVDHAKVARNQSRFELQDEVKPLEIADPEARKARIEQLLARVQPGDVVTVDHAGAVGSDGGHVRVCVGRDEQGRPLFAQAKHDSARVVPEGINDFNWAGEEGIYILRPNTPRVAQPNT